ncbi:MAG: glycosyltransferase family 2 protein [Burkholderiaceae bacterium]|nr:glycosyltransferase family 2 protein [Burkholderiaceae bacterium]
MKPPTVKPVEPADSPSLPSVQQSLAARAGSATRSRVLATIVSYEPDRDALGHLVETLLAGGIDVLIVDNSESESGRVSAQAVAAAFGADFIGNPLNIGVAAAQNVGLRLARERGLPYVLLLDQDSTLQVDTVERLVAALVRLREAGEPAAAVGASFVDPRSGYQAPFAQLRHVRMNKLWPTPGAPAECDVLISSGCLLALDAVERIGLLDESLFIDYVDFEWCLRAQSAGYKLFGVAEATMDHTIGDSSIMVLGRVITLHSPVRNYYFIRNALLFARKPYLTLRWRIHLLYRVVAQFALFGLLCPQRLRRTGWMLRGLWDGALGRAGRLGGAAGLKSLRPQWKVTRPAASAATTEVNAERRLPLAVE